MWRAIYKLFRLTPVLYKGQLYIFGWRGFQVEGKQVQRPWGGICLKVCGESKVKLQRSGLKFVCRARVDIWDHSKMAACFLACQTSECYHLTYNAPCHPYTFPCFYPNLKYADTWYSILNSDSTTQRLQTVKRREMTVIQIGRDPEDLKGLESLCL